MMPSHRDLFDVPRGVAYLNNASYTPLPRVVRQAGDAGVAAKSVPWRMDAAAIGARARAVRNAAGRLVGADWDGMAIVPSVAYGVATAAANLPMPAGTRVLLIEGEFPSQSLEWARRAAACGAVLDVVPRPADGDWTAALLQRIEQPGLAPISIAALTPLHWTDGSLVDLHRLAPALHRQGAGLVVDATQAAGILPVDAAGLGADFVVFPTYKWLLGPYTLAFLYAAPHRRDGIPLERHGANHLEGAEPFSGVPGTLVAGARRYDMGEHLNPVSLPMALAGMDLLHGWGQDAVARRLRAITDALAGVAEAHGLVPVPRRFRPPHILGLRAPADVDLAALVAFLARQDVYVAERGGCLRIGAHVFNDNVDVDRFAVALKHWRVATAAQEH